MPISIPITDRARKYGYIIWPKRLDQEVETVLPRQDAVTVEFQGSDLGERRIDRKYRRISIGRIRTSAIDDAASQFEIAAAPPDRITVRCV